MTYKADLNQSFGVSSIELKEKIIQHLSKKREKKKIPQELISAKQKRGVEHE